jgi:3-dehydroquinate synthetase
VEGEAGVLELVVAASRPYTVSIGRGVLSRSSSGLPRAVVLADVAVSALHGESLGGLSSAPRHLVASGERCKSFDELERALAAMAAADLDRGSVLVALGGGSALDLGGLAAALYMRGIAWVACPTTLLAMVDASVGGKTAVNLSAGKNLAGAFHQPHAVFADLDTLATLPPAELRSGLGEVVKTALLAGGELLARLEASAAACAAGDLVALEPIVAGCVRHKAAVVVADEREAGARGALNLGHTFAHAIERAAGYGLVPHGVAVAAGIGVALAASARLGLLTDPELPERYGALCAELGLPESLAALRAETGLELPPDELLAAARHDKKGSAGTPRLVLPVAPGRVQLGVSADSGTMAALLS